MTADERAGGLLIFAAILAGIALGIVGTLLVVAAALMGHS